MDLLLIIQFISITNFAYLPLKTSHESLTLVFAASHLCLVSGIVFVVRFVYKKEYILVVLFIFYKIISF